jgi:hypothetical protein
VLRTVLYSYETVDLDERARLAREDASARLAAHNARYDQAEEQRPRLRIEPVVPEGKRKRGH